MLQTENTDEIQMDPKDLKDLKRDLLASVFNETHSRLLLYQQGQRRKAAKSNKSKSLSKHSLTLNTNEPLPCEEILNGIKLDQEIDTLRNIFKVAYETVTIDNSHEENPYLVLLKAIENQTHTSNGEELLAKELEENKTILKLLKTQQINKQNEIAEQLSQTTQRLHELREDLKSIQSINRLELKLVEKWERNRLTQAKIMGEKAERLLMKQILEVNRSINNEQRLIHEIEAFRNNEISDLKERIAEWEEKFKQEKTKKTAENLELAQKIADIVKTHARYREIMEERKIFVAEYLKQKAEEQRLYEEQCYRIKCAIRIQAWWRGVMVRRGLGPYRKKSKKGRKSKGKK